MDPFLRSKNKTEIHTVEAIMMSQYAVIYTTFCQLLFCFADVIGIIKRALQP